MFSTIPQPRIVRLTVTATVPLLPIADTVAEALFTGHIVELEATGPPASVCAVEVLAHVQNRLTGDGLALRFTVRLLNPAIPDNDETTACFTVTTQPLP